MCIFAPSFDLPHSSVSLQRLYIVELYRFVSLIKKLQFRNHGENWVNITYDCLKSHSPIGSVD